MGLALSLFTSSLLCALFSCERPEDLTNGAYFPLWPRRPLLMRVVNGRIPCGRRTLGRGVREQGPTVPPSGQRAFILISSFPFFSHCCTGSPFFLTSFHLSRWLLFEDRSLVHTVTEYRDGHVDARLPVPPVICPSPYEGH
ncbi:hypothetical protein CSUI_001131 [Cystoisospora suis]|uniref:Secreted protein n=1 Tax=Cystoisospora suis TaxID=483139 RepID=A0A2C6LDH2_9APIC|nr:hypothetical protein CSUI_001131 [Cystoisospora suis]